MDNIKEAITLYLENQKEVEEDNARSQFMVPITVTP
jgi:predicted RNase H-like HicB family nuclease